MTEQNYPRRNQHWQWLRQRLAKELPEPLSGFAALYQQAMTAGVLSAKTKELIALGIAVSTRNEDCLASHLHDALRAGTTRQEIIETLGVAVLMGGESTTLAACAAFAALEQFEVELAEERATQRLADDAT